MFNLTTTSSLLNLVTGSASDIEVHTSWVDLSGSTVTPGNTNTPSILTATTTAIVGSPAASTVRNVKLVSVRNAHATVSNFVTLRHTDGTTDTEIISVLLGVGESLVYTDTAGFQRFNKNGVLIANAGSDLSPEIGAVALTAANTSSQGGGTIGTDIFLVETFGASGAFLQDVLLVPTASAPTTTTATVIRIFLSSVSSGATSASNTTCIGEMTVPAVAADSATTGQNPFVLPVSRQMKAGWSLLATTHAAPAANTAWKVIAFSGDY